MASCCHRRPTSGLGPAPPVVSPRLGSPAAQLGSFAGPPSQRWPAGASTPLPVVADGYRVPCGVPRCSGNPWNSQSQPASVEQWNETRVVDWLQGLGLSRTQFKEIASQFLEADVDGDELLEIDTIEELEALGISARDTRLSRKLLGDKVLFEIAKLRARVSQRPHNFWEWRAAHPFKGNALYLGARFFPRCTAAYLVIFEPQLLEQLGIGWSSAGLGDSLLGGLAIMLLPYVSLFYYAWCFREIHRYMTLLAAYRALFGTCAELVWLQGRLRVLLNITAWQPPLRRGMNILRGLAALV